MALVVSMLALLLIPGMAFVTSMSRTVRTIERSQPAMGPGDRVAHWRRRTLLAIHLKVLNLAFLLSLLVYVMIARASQSCYGLAVIFLCWVGSRLLPPMEWLRAGGATVLGYLALELERRRRWGPAIADPDRARAIEELLWQVRGQRGVSAR